MQNKIHITESGDRKITFDTPGDHLVFLDNVSGTFVFDIVTPAVHLEIFGAYSALGKKSILLKTIQSHQAPDTWSNLLIKGVFEDESVFDYKGLVKIEKNCNGSHAYQKNQNLLLSHKARVSSEPDLEILSPDVFCTHGSTTGGMNKDHLYYLQSRGISETESRIAYIDGFLRDVYDRGGVRRR